MFPLAGQVSIFPWTEDFEQFGLCVPDCKIPCPLNSGWINESGDDFDWIIHTGSTPSAQTGPTRGIQPIGGQYLYMESNTACTGGREAHLHSPVFDFRNVHYPVLEFYFHAFGLGEGLIHLDVYVNGLWQNDIIEPIQGSVNEWQTRHVPLPFAAGLNNVRLRWRGVTGPVETCDFAIDGILIRQSSSDDLAPVGLSPSSRLCGLGNDTLDFIIQNLGAQAQQSVETKISWGNGIWSGIVQHPVSIQAGKQSQLSLPAPPLQPGTHTIQLITRASNGTDKQPSNDTLVTTIDVRPVITSLPYLATFEIGPMHWFSEGTRNSWQQGVPNGNILSYTPDGNFCWGTNLTGNYDPFTYAFLYSPCFDLRKIREEVILSFDLNTNLEFGLDKLWLEYSLDGGSWQKLGTRASGIQGWYNHSQDFWTGTPHAWGHAAHSLHGLEGHMVQFRFVHYSDGSRQAEGVLMDRFMLRYAYDLAVTAVLPDDACDLGLTASETISVEIENLGFYDAGQIDLHFRIDNGSFGITETYVGPLKPEASHVFVFSKTADLSAKGSHWIEAEALFMKDLIPDNNILRERAGNYPPLSIDLGPDTSICPGERLILKSGVPGGQYWWSTGNITQDLYVFTGGKFSVKVIDSVGCEAIDSIVVDMPQAVRLDIQTLLPVACYGDSGMLEVITAGGVGPFDYRWSTGDSTHITSLIPGGQYSLQVTDSKGCEYQEQFILEEPAPLQIRVDTIRPV
ncbi:MAG: hypothetical protein R3B47_13915 [Bacteroidia bacterium]